jgi:DegV family protein with EDD domain
MAQAIGIVTDSSSDLPPDLAEQYGIDIVSLIVHFGSEDYLDSALPPEDFWAKAAGPDHPRTSQPAVGDFEAVFERLIGQGKQVLCVTVTSKHSGTFNAARLAAERFGEAVQVFDSWSFSLGLGLQTLFAAQSARAGRSMQEILDALHDLRDRMRFTIVLDTLENLRRGGRADGFISIADRMARALNIKVIVNAVEGQLRLLGAARSFKGALRRVLSQVEHLAPLQDLAVAHTRSQQLAEQVAQDLARRLSFPLERIWLRETGAVLSTHAGPGVIAVLAVPKPLKNQD